MREKLVQAWLEIHGEDLMADWDLAVTGMAPFKIYHYRRTSHERT
ncbi:MAG: hypothetical protein ACOYL3_06035 [Desulfuromonadaceae bacterium]